MSTYRERRDALTLAVQLCSSWTGSPPGPSVAIGAARTFEGYLNQVPQDTLMRPPVKPPQDELVHTPGVSAEERRLVRVIGDIRYELTRKGATAQVRVDDAVMVLYRANLYQGDVPQMHESS